MSEHVPYTAERTKDKYYEQIGLGLYWCVYINWRGRAVIAWCPNKESADQIAHVLNKQVGVET